MNEPSSTTGAGQQYPRDSDDEVNKIDFAVRQIVAQMVTTRLVQVVAVHGGAGAVATAGTVDVLPLVNQIDGAGNATANDTVYGIPWSRLQGGSSAVIVDPVVGDIGYVSCCDRDISNVKASLARSNPGSFRKFDLADGIYFGGCLNVAPGQYLVFTATGCRLVDINGNSIVLSPTGIVLTDVTGNAFNMSSTGIGATPAAGLPFTVNGKLVVTDVLVAESSFQLTGTFSGAAGVPYPSALHIAGDVIGGFGTGDPISLQTHLHTSGSPGTPTSPPIP